MNNKLSTEIKLEVFSALKVAYYFLGQPKQARKYLNNDQVNLRKDISQSALFFNLLGCTNKITQKKMESTLKRISCYTDLNRPQYKFEKDFLPFSVNLLMIN